MKKKVMLLIAIIPLIFMLTIFSVSKAVSIVVSIPVSGIRITTQNDDGIITLDMATYNDDLYLSADVYPADAKNKDYTVTVTGVGDESAADITVENDGRVLLHGTGRAKLTVTSNENAFTDSVILNVISTKIIDFIPVLSAGNGEVQLIKCDDEGIDYEADVYSGDLFFGAKVFPQNFSESAVKWYSDDENLVTINEYLGKARAALSGSVVVTAVNDDGIKGQIKKKIKLNIQKAFTETGITLNGGENANVICPTDSLNTLLLLELPIGKTADDIIVRGANVANYRLIAINDSPAQYMAEIEFYISANCTVGFSVDGQHFNNVAIAFSEYAFDIYTGYHISDADNIFHKNNVTVSYIAAGNVYDSSITYRWETSDPSILDVVADDFVARVTAHNTGTAKLTVTAFKNGVDVGKSVVKNVTVITPVSYVDFTANATTHGISDLLAVGDLAVSGTSYVQSPKLLTLRAQNGTTVLNFDLPSFEFFSSDTSVASPIVSRTELRVKSVSSGMVTFSAKWIYADYFKENVSATITFKMVKGGVNVANYYDLKKATDDGKPVVLTSDVMLGAKTSNLTELNSFAATMPTTWDWQYYENQGLLRPEVLYLIEFKNDVYGNGHEINADYITQAKDATGKPLLFKGPLDFVAISVAAVKGQDNISFLARTAGITLDNVVLKGCKDESLINDDGDFDLSLLNFVGTTLEVADNVTVKNCRVSNGRTVMRVYGGGCADDSSIVSDVSEITAVDERINVLVESCILTNAREFILKTGSNRALRAIGDEETPFFLQKLPCADGSTYDCYDKANATDEYFYNKYVTTDITLKNSVLATSGLFSIGIEAHFGGEMLSGAKGSSSPKNWLKLAATSYACALHLEGDVKLWDWKKLTNVDSSTLIETSGDLGDNKQFLQLNIAKMLNKVSNNTAYKNVLTNIDGENFVHGGIALYGGGYNYSFVDFSGLSENTERLNSYKVSLSVLAAGEPENSMLYLQGMMLPLAAGPSDFLFYMYDNTSATNYLAQTNAVLSGNAYKIPAAK